MGPRRCLGLRQSRQAGLAGCGHGEVGDLRVDSIGLRLITVEANNRELLSYMLASRHIHKNTKPLAWEVKDLPSRPGPGRCR